MHPQHHHAFDESFEGCIKCTAFTAVCPVSRQNQITRVQKQSGPDGERLQQNQPSFMMKH